MQLTAFFNEVAAHYKKEKDLANNRLPKGHFDEIVKQIRLARNIPDDVRLMLRKVAMNLLLFLCCLIF